MKTNLIILYVDNPFQSSVFYQTLLGKKPFEEYPTYIAFTLDSGIILGLCSKHTIEPTAYITGGGCEVAFTVEDKETVDTTYEKWTKGGARVAQTPTEMCFGYTFVVLDPDGHRLRVLSKKAM
jgi:predicted enzyme related to lactoylglutathione lyase